MYWDCTIHPGFWWVSRDGCENEIAVNNVKLQIAKLVDTFFIDKNHYLSKVIKKQLNKFPIKFQTFSQNPAVIIVSLLLIKNIFDYYIYVCLIIMTGYEKYVCEKWKMP